MTTAAATISEFLTAAAAKRPTPGGGSVTALVGALAAAMGEMAVNYSLGRKGLEAHQPELARSLAELERARRVLVGLMVEDQSAYEQVAALRKAPATDPAKLAATVGAVRVPQAVGATALAVLGICERLADKVNPWLRSDLMVCAELSVAVVRCAAINVRVNLPDLPDGKDRRDADAMVTREVAQAVAIIRRLTARGPEARP